MIDDPLLEVRDLVKRYPVPRGIFGALTGAARLSVHAVDGVSFSVRAGELVALVGESGCGKTTTAQAVMRMTEPQAGSIRFRGQELTELGQRALRPFRRELQMIYQDPYESLDPRFRVRDTVAEPLRIHQPRLAAAERQARVLAALELVGLTPAELYVDRYPHELSGGQRQRVAIAAATVLEPAFLVADEPVSMLDVSVRVGILRLLDALRGRGLGILMITHDLSTAARFADRICVMYLGRIVEQGSARAVVEGPRHPYTQALISAVPRRDPLAAASPVQLKGEPGDPTLIPSGCRFHPRCPIALPACRAPDLDVALDAGPDGHGAACIRAE